MLAQPKLLSWSATKSRIHNQLQYAIKARVENAHAGNRGSTLSSRIPQFPLFECHTFAKYQFDTRLQTFAYYRSVDEDEDGKEVEDMIIASLIYDNQRDPRSAVFVYFTSLSTGAIRRCIKHDFQFPSFQLLKYIAKLKIVVGIFKERMYLLSNKNGHLKYLTSVNCSGTVRRIIYDRTTRDYLYLGGDQGLFTRWNLIRDKNGYELRSGDRMRSVFITKQLNIIDMKMDPITHKLFVVGHKGCLIFDTLLNREWACVLSAHTASVTCANIYGFSIIMGFEDGLMKIFEMASDSIPVRYQLQAHQASIISMLITADGVIITGAADGSVHFYSLDTLLKLGEYRFHASIERMIFVRGEDILVKFQNDLQLLTFNIPIRNFSSALQTIESARVTFPVGSIPSRVVTRSTENLFTIYNPRSTQILNVIPLSPDRIVIQDFVYDTAGEILYILTGKTVCSYHCATQPSYLLNIFEVKEDCLFTKLCCLMWFSLLPEHTRKRRAFGVVFVGTTNGKLYLVPGDHELKYALLPDTPSALYSFYQILSESVKVNWLEIFQAHENYTTRRGARYLMAVGDDLIAKFYRLSITGHEVYLRRLNVTVYLDAACIGAAMADVRMAIACQSRGYIRMFSVTNDGLDEISPKDILHEHSPIKSITGCESSGLFASLNNLNEIMLWTRNNEAIRKIRSDVPLISISNLNDRGDLLLVASRRLYFLMISDFAPEEILFDLTKKQIKDDPIELPVQTNKNFDTTVLKSAQTVQLDERAHPKNDLNDSDETLGFFEALEQERIQREMSKMLDEKKSYPVAPDALIPNSSLRSMFKMKPIEPIEVKMFRLRLTTPMTDEKRQVELNERLKRFAVLSQFDGILSNMPQLLNRIDILENLQSQGNKNLQWQNDDDEWVEIEDPDAVQGDGTTRPVQRQRSSRSRPTTSNMFSRTTFDEIFANDFSYNFAWDEDTMPEIFRRLKKEPWFDLPNTEENNDLRSMLLYLIETIKTKNVQSYEKACEYLVEIFRLYGIEPSLIDQILNIFINHLNISQDDPLDIHTVRAMAQFMIERKDVIVALLDTAIKSQPTEILRYETINAVKYITDVNSSEDIDLVLENMPIIYNAADDTFSLKTIIDRLKAQRKSVVSQEGENGTDENPGEKLHPLLEKISKERWYPRDNCPVTLDAVIDAILAKLPNASKTMLKSLTSYLIQLNRQIGFSDEQFSRVAKGLINLLGHNDADYRLIAATILAELGKETKDIDLALLDSFINDPRILVRTECGDSLKKLTGITSDTVLKDCSEDLPILRTLPEEGFSLQNYLNLKNRVPTPPPPPAVLTEELETTAISDQTQGEETTEHVDTTKDPFNEEEEGMQKRDEDEDEDDRDYRDDERVDRDDDDDHHVDEENGRRRDEYPSVVDEDQQKYLDEQSRSITIPPTDGRKSTVRFRTPSPSDERRHSRASQIASGKEATHISTTTTSHSSTTNVTPVQPPIRVEFNEKTRPNNQTRQPVPRIRREGTLPSFSSNRATRQTTMISDPTNRSTRQTTIPNEPSDRSPNRLTVPEQPYGRRTGLLPNNPKFWDVIEKQNELNEQRRKEEISHSRVHPELLDGSFVDPIDTIFDDHRRDNGMFRPRRDRPILIPHKISLGDVFGDQTHLTIDRKFPPRSVSRVSNVSNSMQLSDLDQNKRHLRDVESVQLFSSLIVRSIQVHRKYVPFVPGSWTLDSDSTSTFADALTISQMQLHSSSLGVGLGGHRLPPIVRPRPSSAETSRIANEANARAMRAGINVRKAQDMEDALSNLLQNDRQSRHMTTTQHTNTPLPPRVPAEAEEHGVTHAWLLEQLLRSQGKPTSRSQIQKILRAYPKFIPLLNSRVPSNLIPVIWNDPVIKQLASIISKAPDESTSTSTGTTTQAFEEPNRQTQTKSTIPTFDEEHSSNFFDYTAPAHLAAIQQQQREEYQKKHLPPIRGLKVPLPRHVLRFGFRELELDSPEASIESLRDEHVSKARRRRIYMHLMFTRHELLKSQLRQMLKTDSRTTSYLPIITRPPMCH